jgi:two-component system phosphate regulon sensor histidine kinase PhoR
LAKSTALVVLAPFMLMLIFVMYDIITPFYALIGIGSVFIVSFIFVHPYIANLSALTYYVEQLSKDKNAEAPDLSFLNNVEQLTEAVQQLNDSWNTRKAQLENMVSESKILIDSLPDMLIMLDDDLSVLRTNSTLHLTFGRFHEEVVELFLKDPRIAGAINKARDERRGQDLEFSISEPFDRDYVIHIERLPIYAPGGIAILIALHDVTELKRTEQMFADFVANASHEIRTPLTSIVGFIETLQQGAKDDPKARDQFLKIMEEQGDRMARLITDLLSLSKIEKSSRTLPSGKANITDILRQVVKDLKWPAEEKHIDLALEKSKDIPSIMGDPEELAQVFTNLINNAIKYSPEKSEIVVKVGIQEGGSAKEKMLRGAEKMITVSIIDQGEGIEKEHISRLTERFYRVDTARSRKEGGTGLGLAIVKHILDRHKGHLNVESAKDKGSTFTVLLPAT